MLIFSYYTITNNFICNDDKKIDAISLLCKRGVTTTLEDNYLLAPLRDGVKQPFGITLSCTNKI